MCVGAALGEAREADGGVWCLGAEVFDLEFEPAFELVGGDRDSWVAADRQLDHGPSLDAGGPCGNGCQRASRAGHTHTPAGLFGDATPGYTSPKPGMVIAPYRSPSVAERAWDSTLIPTGQVPTMRRNPFLDFQLTAEKAGYPALLFVSLLCLTLVVVPVALLALTQAVWVLGLAVLSLIGAIAILSAGIAAAFADRGEPDLEAPNAGAASDESPQVVPLRRSFQPPGDGHDRRAA